MIDPLAFALTVGCLGLALAVLAMLALRRYRWRRVLPSLVLLELGIVAQAGLDVAGLLAGHRPAETVTHLAYLATSLVVLPAAAGGGGRGGDHWSALLLVVALLALAVIVVRLMTTWH